MSGLVLFGFRQMRLICKHEVGLHLLLLLNGQVSICLNVGDLLIAVSINALDVFVLLSHVSIPLLIRTQSYHRLRLLLQGVLLMMALVYSEVIITVSAIITGLKVLFRSLAMLDNSRVFRTRAQDTLVMIFTVLRKALSLHG